MAKKGEVLAFEKKLVVSDGYMYGTTWEDRSGKAVPKSYGNHVRGERQAHRAYTIGNKQYPSDQKPYARHRA